MEMSLAQRNWRNLIKPKGLEIDRSSLSDSYGKFVAKPLERGFGLTIGNSLRRILLNSLQGVGVTAVRIDGVLHEFSSIPDVVEDVTDILLNIKEVRFKMYAEGPKVLVIDKKGPGDVRASDIKTDETVEVLNPDQLICTTGKDGHFKGEIWVEHGRGYVTSEEFRRNRPDLPAGVIPLDAFFSPIRKAVFMLSPARVGHRTDYERLDLEVQTDGSVRPEDAVAYASKILKDQLSIFINFDESLEPEVEIPVVEKGKINENLYRTVDELELSVRSANCLQNAGIKYIGELVQKTEAEMLKTKNFGRKSLNEIKEILSEMGLGFGMKIEGFDPEAYFAQKKKKESETLN